MPKAHTPRIVPVEVPVEAAPLPESHPRTLTLNPAALPVMSAEMLAKSIEEAEKKQQLMKEYIMRHLVEGVDYGKIVGQKNNLLKPGMEKIFAMLSITVDISQDKEVWEMLGSKAGTVALKCVCTQNGRVIAEGRGVEKVGNKSRDENTTVKIAEKRARIDACLSLGFSDYFTQDLEDLTLETEKVLSPEKAAPPERRTYARSEAQSGQEELTFYAHEVEQKTAQKSGKAYLLVQSDQGTILVFHDRDQLQAGLRFTAWGRWNDKQDAFLVSKFKLSADEDRTDDVPF